MDRALIVREMLYYKQFAKFIRERSVLMVEKVRERLQFTTGDFEGLSDEE